MGKWGVWEPCPKGKCLLHLERRAPRVQCPETGRHPVSLSVRLQGRAKAWSRRGTWGVGRGPWGPGHRCWASASSTSCSDLWGTAGSQHGRSHPWQVHAGLEGIPGPSDPWQGHAEESWWARPQDSMDPLDLLEHLPPNQNLSVFLFYVFHQLFWH